MSIGSCGKSAEIASSTFPPSVMVSAGICYGGTGKLHFIAEKAKISAECYRTKLIKDCQLIIASSIVIFQQDGASAHNVQEWHKQNSPDFLKKDEWPPNSPDLNPLDYHVWGAMLEKYQAHIPKPKNEAELKMVLEAISADLPQKPIDKAVLAFRKRLTCVRAGGSHFQHQL